VISRRASQRYCRFYTYYDKPIIRKSIQIAKFVNETSTKCNLIYIDDIAIMNNEKRKLLGQIIILYLRFYTILEKYITAMSCEN